MEYPADMPVNKLYIPPDEQPTAVYVFDPIACGIVFVNIPSAALYMPNIASSRIEEQNKGAQQQR